jgi:hypothetical protein
MSDRLLSLVVDSRSAQDRTPAGALFQELDWIRTLTDTFGEDGERVPAGGTGTVVAVRDGGAAFDAELTRPVEALAAITPDRLALVERAGD